MTTRMLIDATHAEETRIVVVDGKRLVDFDFETATKRQLKGNIYLAKVTRVEPSLQAAFVDYGGNRHGFLAFNEIHPDYYQIPVADREALLQDEAEQAARQAELEDRVDDNGGDDDEDDGDGADYAEADGEGVEAAEPDAGGEDVDAAAAEVIETDTGAEIDAAANDLDAEADGESDGDDDGDEPEAAQEAGAVDALDEVPRPRGRSRRSYKIQEVIKRRQILLIQVVKEERGNKGAALTTYLSLAGRYCVLMPNTARGGGISRKIANQSHRRKLKDIVSDLDVPQGMGVIVRTAGQNRTKSEIRRDFEYLLRLWDSVRDLTLDSTAPMAVYEEADLIKRAIRDMYAKDIDEILVDGEDGYRVAKDFMRMLMPSHAKKVQPYRDRIPLLHRYQVEQQLDGMHSNVVQLKSGGYLVLAQTEALVAIDVNSGRSTKERNIEETALKTNLEAATEVGRQLRLRDLAGLVVIDFIDMDENRNNRAVERRMKEALKDDRARIQVGRISSFGLMEMSRQRLRPSLFEASTTACEVCAGTGFVRTTESTALHVLRAIEEEGIRGRAAQLSVHAPAEVALYLLNQKRDHLAEIEQRYGMQVYVMGDDALVAPDCRVTIDRTRTAEEIESERRRSAVLLPGPEDDDDQAADERAAAADKDSDDDGEKAKEKRPRRRRRSRRRGEDKKSEEAAGKREAGEADSDAANDQSEAAAGEAASDEIEADGEEKPRRRRRGRRGGRRRRANGEQAANDDQAEGTAEGADAIADTPDTADTSGGDDGSAAEVDGAPSEPAPEETVDTPAVVEPAASWSASREATKPIGFTSSGMTGGETVAEPVAEPEVAEQDDAPAAAVVTPVADAIEATDEVVAIEAEPAGPELTPEPQADASDAGIVSDDGAATDPDQPKRRGWWQRGRLF
ncbi:MAG: Rne/Rng family ribonuclease [Alphaproteobacteria bacterium]|nr:Rne/Rng family ribonuclease [Alphaproteobacteria bacterium]